MTIGNRIKTAFGLKRYETGANYILGQSLNSTAVSNIFGSGGKEINVLEEYSGIAWKCINLRAETLADQDLFVERLVGQKWQEDPNHPFNFVLEGGEGSLDQSELLEAWSKSMDLYGEAFWYYSKGETFGKPQSIYPLDPAAMTVYVQNNRITGYLYQKDGARIALELDEVDYWRISNPATAFRGMGPMQAAGWFIRSSRYVQTYVNNFLENNAIPAGIIVANNDVADADWQVFKESWSAKYSGIDNSGKTGFIRGSDLSFVKTGMSLGEVDFEQVKSSSREDIMIMFGISKPMMAIFDDINRASAVTARQLFAISITSPALRRLKRKISKSVAYYFGPQYRIGSTNPVPEDDEIKYARLEKGVNKWMTVNEARIADGLEPLGPEYDVIQVFSPPTPAAEPKKLGKIVIRKRVGFSYEMKENFRSQTEGHQLKAELSFWQKANPILNEQKQMVIDQLKPKKVVHSSFDTQIETEKLAETVLPLFIELAVTQGQLATEFAGNADLKFELTPVMRTVIAESVRKAIHGFTEETQEKVSAAIAQGLQDGESINKLTQRIDSIYKDVTGIKEPGYRIERLARTEVIKNSNAITQAAYKQTGVVHKKEWFANPGACEYCKALSGSVVQLGSSFVSKGSPITGVDGGTYVNDYEDVEYPGVHPNCRCTLLPVIEDN